MHLSPWGRVVAISALLVVGGALVLAAGALASRSRVVAVYPITGAVERLAFDLGDGEIMIVGGARSNEVEVRRTERYSFGHRAQTRRSVGPGAYAVRSRCPTALLGACRVSYRVRVPDNVALDVRTTSGSVALRGYRGSAKLETTSGAIAIEGYCGNSLDARAGAGDIALEATCAPPQLSLRTGSGSVRAGLPAGRYNLDAESTSGAARVRGITARDDAPYTIQALSASGDVEVEGRS